MREIYKNQEYFIALTQKENGFKILRYLASTPFDDFEMQLGKPAIIFAKSF